MEYHGLDVSKERADLAAYNALITAAAAARKRGLPLVLDPMLVMSKPTPAWTDVVSDVAGLFRRVGAGERAARQMTADVMLDIVGEEISFEAVRSELRFPEREAKRAGKRAD